MLWAIAWIWLVLLVTGRGGATGAPRGSLTFRVPPTPTGTGGLCPFMTTQAGGSVATDPTGTASCPEAKAVRAWQGLKFGLFLHWGPYSQLGVDASWSLNWATACTFGNVGLCAPKPCSQCTEADMTAYRQKYWDLATTFNPTKFNPTLWAEAATAAGMKYFVMTTKHHDGFAMYNTSAKGAPSQAVYGVTGPDCPVQRDLFGEVVAAMRGRGLAAGAYFSKADWHADSFWDPTAGFASTRDTNYNISDNPERYAQFVAFDQRQLDEIVTGYSPDIVWLDAGWVGPGNGLQTLPLPEWAAKARKALPAQLWVNRDGKVDEDYLTPENPPPEEVLRFGLGLYPKPWEVCLTLGEQWAYKVNDTYKSSATIVQTLVSVVATGGSLLLDIGPMPTGELPLTALARLAEVGQWMNVNGEAIHDTVPVFPFAINVTTAAHRPKVPEWQLAANRTHLSSASCAEAGSNTGATLKACMAYCFETLSGCNTINVRNEPPVCIPKNCVVPGTPLVPTPGGYDVYTLKNVEEGQTLQWRLSRKGDVVYAILLLDGATLPNIHALELPFVVNAPGGTDGSWPTVPLQNVTLLGADPVVFDWSDRNGLLLKINPNATAPHPDAAVFKLTFSS